MGSVNSYPRASKNVPWFQILRDEEQDLEG